MASAAARPSAAEVTPPWPSAPKRSAENLLAALSDVCTAYEKDQRASRSVRDHLDDDDDDDATDQLAAAAAVALLASPKARPGATTRGASRATQALSAQISSDDESSRSSSKVLGRPRGASRRVAGPPLIASRVRAAARGLFFRRLLLRVRTRIRGDARRGEKTGRAAAVPRIKDGKRSERWRRSGRFERRASRFPRRGRRIVRGSRRRRGP